MSIHNNMMANETNLDIIILTERHSRHLGHPFISRLCIPFLRSQKISNVTLKEKHAFKACFSLSVTFELCLTDNRTSVQLNQHSTMFTTPVGSYLRLESDTHIHFTSKWKCPHCVFGGSRLKSVNSHGASNSYPMELVTHILTTQGSCQTTANARFHAHKIS